MAAYPSPSYDPARARSSSRTPREAWISRALLAAWLSFLAYSAGGPAAAPAAPALDRGAVLGWAADVATAAALEAARFVPVGLLLVLSLPRRIRWWRRLLLVTAPALGTSLALALALAALRRGGWPALPAATLPMAGALLGTWMGLAWTGGPRARIVFLPKLAVLAVAFVMAGVAVAAVAVQDRPLAFEPPEVASEDKRRLARAFKEQNPAQIPEGETRTLRLTEHDLDLLLAWGLPLARSGVKSKVDLGDYESVLQVSARLPAGRGSGYLNFVASGLAFVEDGRLSVRPGEVRVGGLDLPRPILDLLGQPLVDLALRDPRLRPASEAIRDVSFEEGAVALTYGRTSLPRGFLADLFGGQGTSEDLVPAVRAQVEHLLEGTDGLPRGDARFGAFLEKAFGLARRRSARGGPVLENQAAILALGMVLGHRRVEAMVGQVLDDGLRDRARAARRGTTLRGRADWTQHFLVSASLTVLAAGSVSDAVGLFKEERDADGGSGFSFGDLLADRAGTRFAQTATRDEASAAGMQQRLARGFRVDHFFPEADGLPEGISDAELHARYGGVGGARYRELVQDLERRLDACEAYR